MRVMLEKRMNKFIQYTIKNSIAVYLGWWLIQSVHISALVLMVELTVHVVAQVSLKSNALISIAMLRLRR